MSVTKEDMEKGYLLNDNANDKEVSHEGTSTDQGQPERPQEGHWHSWALGKRTSLRSIQAGLRLIRIPFFYKKRGKEYVRVFPWSSPAVFLLPLPEDSKFDSKTSSFPRSYQVYYLLCTWKVLYISSPPPKKGKSRNLKWLEASLYSV